MNTKHTAGPWTIICDDKVTRIYYLRTAQGVPHFSEGKANAHLIAAAPELLEALEDAEFLLRKAAQVAGPMRESFARSAEDARVAIAKAVGEV
jgi:hypothetical protein